MEDTRHNGDRVVAARRMAAQATADSHPWLSNAVAGPRNVFLVMAFIAGCAFLSYAETFASMVAVWGGSRTFVYGFLVLPVSAALIWRRKKTLNAVAVRPSSAGFACLAMAVVAWHLAGNAYVQAGQHFAFIAIIVTGIWAVLGTRVARIIRFPLLFAFFSVPVGEFLIPPLMNWTARFTVWALNATGIPVYLEAYRFFLPSGTFEVIETCSGIRYLLVAVVLAVFFAHEKFSSAIHRTLFVFSAAVGSIIANGIRAYLVVLVAHLSKMKFATGEDHVIFGWVVFVALIVVIFWAGDRLGNAEQSVRVPSFGKASGPSEQPDGRVTLLALSGALAIIALGSHTQAEHATRGSGAQIVTLPRGLEPWSGPGPTVLAYRPSFMGDFEAVHAGYSSANGSVDVHEIFFAEQTQGSELVGQGSKIYGERWRLIRRLEKESIVVQGTTMQVNSLVLSDGQEDVLLWYWYDIGGWLTTSDLATKFYHAIQALLGRNSGDAAVILATPATMSGDGRDSVRLAEFLDSHMARLSACLRAAAPERAKCTDPL